ncbi:MAG: hypothetical protein DRR16_06090 [Candidatus Parabeggiatoa sp. nov. 3]|jgi:hypothetical protein|nr:MAG: hypothetical protein DRQ99_06405 [Gammaproteobacteria bacterium]RKZ87952.1 MAG: hypothetical protein DRR16_06090 [Gammaproteobacteria bacterium]
MNPLATSHLWYEDYSLAGTTLTANPLTVGQGGTTSDRIVGNTLIRGGVVVYEELQMGHVLLKVVFLGMVKDVGSFSGSCVAW